MKKSILLLLTLGLAFSSFPQNKSSKYLLDVGEIEHLFFMPKFSFAQNYILAHDYTFTGSSSGGMYYEFESNASKGKTLIRFRCFNESIMEIQIFTDDIEFINRLKGSPSKFGYENAKIVFPAPKAGDAVWIKERNFLGKNLYFSLSCSVITETGKTSFSFFAELRNL